MKKRILSIMMVVMMVITMLPSTAFATWTNNAQTVDLTVGEKLLSDITLGGSYSDTLSFLPDGEIERNDGAISLTSGTVPNGITLGYGGIQKEPQISGTPTAGTVGTHVLTFTDSTDSSTLQVTINIAKGTQTIGVDDGENTNVNTISIPFGADYTLDTYSTDANGDKIDVSAVDTSLVADHQPTYTYASSDTSIVTVDETTGVITPVSVGTTTITINSATTESYEAATEKTISLTVTGHKVTSDLTNLTTTGLSGVGSSADYTATLTANTGYALPESITVTGASSHTYNSSTGEITISSSDITGDITITASGSLITYTVTFKADGTEVETVNYTVENTTITEPTVPSKDYHEGAWESYTLTTGDVTVNATYTPIEYTVTFVADGVTVDTQTYTVEDTSITEPTVPSKDYYEGAWESYSLTGGDVTVNAVYTANAYTVTFIADGVTVDTQTYTVEDTSITEPTVPSKDYYEGAWESYTLTGGDVTVNAVYTANAYTVTFIADRVTVDTQTYTVEDTSITEPTVPSKDYYEGAWESYSLTGGDVTVNAVYTQTSLLPQTLTFTDNSVTKSVEDAIFENVLIGANTTVTYATSNEDVATVDVSSGLVTIVGAGTATITATAVEDTTYQSATSSFDLIVNEGEISLATDQTVVFDAEYKDLKEVILTVNGTPITLTQTDNLLSGYTGYTFNNGILGEVNEGSVEVTLYKEFLATLPAGSYSVSITTNDGNSDITSTITGTIPTKTTHTVTINNDGSGTSGTLTNQEYGTVIDLTAGTRSGYTFSNWTVTGDIALSDNQCIVLGDGTITAVYTPIEYTVTFIADGTTVATETYTVENTTITEPSVPSKDDYNGVWESYTLTNGDVTVNAIYTKNQYNVTISGGSIQDTLVTWGEIVTITADAAPSGQQFKEWVVNNGDITLSDTTSETATFTMPTKDVNVTATYEDIPVIDTEDDTETDDEDVVQTGDNSSPQTLIVLMFVSLLGIFIVSKKRLAK